MKFTSEKLLKTFCVSRKEEDSRNFLTKHFEFVLHYKSIK